MNFNKFFNTICVTVMMVIASCFMIGCSQDMFEDDTNISDMSEYLSVSSTNLLNLSEADAATVQLAFKRIDIRFENGLYGTKFSSGSQINMSGELFSIFKDAINNSNKAIKEASLKPKIPRLKNGNESSTSNDCVAYAIQSVLYGFGTSMSLSSINTWLVDQYGTQGVPLSSFSAAVSHFLNGSPVTISNNYSIPSGKKVIIVLRTGPSSGHAVTLLSVSGGNVLYSDPQNGGGGYAPISDIVSAFECSGAK
jgi:hypothetical protein